MTPEGARRGSTFDTATSTGIDGVDADGVPGHRLQLNLQINGLYQNDLVFVPSPGAGRRCQGACHSTWRRARHDPATEIVSWHELANSRVRRTASLSPA